MKRIVWVIAGCFVLLGTTHAVSFDCSKATTKIEKIICGDNELSKLDDQLNSTYKTSLQEESDADVIRHDQKEWMKARNTCQDVTCIKLAYEKRISDLTLISNSQNAAIDRASPLIGVWSISQPSYFDDIKLVIQRKWIDYGRCARMNYLVVYQKDDLFLLKVQAPRSCLHVGQEAMFLALTVSGDRMVYRSCESNSTFEKLKENSKDVLNYCSPQGVHRDSSEPSVVDRQSLEAEHKGGCKKKILLSDDQAELYRAIDFNKTDSALKLIESGMNVQFFGPWESSPLGLALAQGNLSVIRALLKAGADAQHTYCDNTSPFALIATTPSGKRDQLLITQALLDAHADANNQFGYPSPLESALWTKKYDVADILLRNGVDIDGLNKAGGTPLTDALKLPLRDEQVRYLLDHGANPNVRNKKGETPLSLSVSIISTPIIVRLLIDHGARVNDKVDGKTALEIVEGRKSKEVNAADQSVIEMLKKASVSQQTP
jgi:uncharacterized protein/ankyrin repeat protein